LEYSISKKKSVDEIWGSIAQKSQKPLPIKFPSIKKVQVFPERTPEQQERLGRMLKTIPDEFRGIYEDAFYGKTKLDDLQKKQVFQYIKDKEIKKEWQQIFFQKSISESNPESKQSYQNTKENRIKKLKEIMENKKIVLEKDLMPMIFQFRSYLAIPIAVKVDGKEFSLRFMLDSIKYLETTLAEYSLSKEELRQHLLKDTVLFCAFEYHLGIISLYSAQVKWFYPNLIGIDHMEIRDLVMHGNNHNYFRNMKKNGSEQID